jgi:hypothetical protein
MRRTTVFVAVAAALAALTVGVIAATAGTGRSDGMTMSRAGHRMSTTSARQVTAADLRVTLDRLLGEHAVLAMNATDLGVTGSKAFPAAAKALDRNSVEISQAIGSIYGARAAKTFLDGPFQWRAHIGFFVDYTVALARRTGRAGETVANLNVHGPAVTSSPGRPGSSSPSATTSRPRPPAQEAARRLRRRPLHAGG